MLLPYLVNSAPDTEMGATFSTISQLYTVLQDKHKATGGKEGGVGHKGGGKGAGNAAAIPRLFQKKNPTQRPIKKKCTHQERWTNSGMEKEGGPPKDPQPTNALSCPSLNLGQEWSPPLGVVPWLEQRKQMVPGCGGRVEGAAQRNVTLKGREWRRGAEGGRSIVAGLASFNSSCKVGAAAFTVGGVGSTRGGVKGRRRREREKTGT